LTVKPFCVKGETGGIPCGGEATPQKSNLKTASELPKYKSKT
jgi:hypothetical protein